MKSKLTFRHFLPLGLLAPFALGLTACETDLDPNDSYRETTVIYAVLDPTQTRQIVRINKAFLNTGTDARVIAATQPDSINFPAGVIEAKLEFLRPDSSVVVSYPLDRAVNTAKQPGEFSTEGQVVYQTRDDFPGLSPDTSLIYRVVALNTRKGTVARGATRLPLAYNPGNPRRDNNLYFRSAGSASYLFDRQNELKPYNPGTRNARVSVTTQRRASLYAIDLDFHFLEINGTDTVRRTLTWNLFDNVTFEQFRGEELSLNIPDNGFFDQFLRSKINVAADPAGLKRVIDNPAITWRASAGSPVWSQYLQVINSASAISQTTPEFTNIQGGRGLVVGRVKHTINQFIDTNPGSQARNAFASHPEFKFVF